MRFRDDYITCNDNLHHDFIMIPSSVYPLSKLELCRGDRTCPLKLCRPPGVLPPVSSSSRRTHSRAFQLTLSILSSIGYVPPFFLPFPRGMTQPRRPQIREWSIRHRPPSDDRPRYQTSLRLAPRNPTLVRPFTASKPSCAENTTRQPFITLPWLREHLTAQVRT